MTTTPYVPDTAEAILDRARELVPFLRENSARIEDGRRLPEDIVELLRGAGVFRAAMPKTWGGPELTSMQQAELLEILSAGDVSVGWCAMIGMDSGIYSGYLDDEVARGMWPTLAESDTGPAGPAGLLSYVDSALADPLRGGCMVTHGVLERLPGDGKAAQRLGGALGSLEEAFAYLLLRARAAGELAPGTDVRSTTRFLVTLTHGLRVMERTAGRDYLAQVVDQALQGLSCTA
ncbi:TetR family transcriptional regulator C-terminal domain-containing protein [Streptomyces erythrochromogenes]|uniref:TetR family transcriptional regulator C-terminal domain-containing protein n=1 Tax=Streptomyces erythrochromogenes TaxID=285574 RepID=UPI00224E7DBD|nr:acyl-CoA dehydrogenase family protein [Streptomyces erythrochromogenes]MCX5587364.1 acyl-CoA dehydrogenase family protein [Streptomyces erythrochromogenes]